EGSVPLTGGASYHELDQVTVVASRSHLTTAVEAFVADLKQAGKEVEFLSAGSSLKLCLVAEGKADVYPRLGPTMEWDTGAAHAIALEAGREVVRADTGEPLTYNKPELLNPHFLVR
ncbi:MAG: inositol monophosphatase family protein, partial [Verrucomicrobiota bacterium]